MQSTPEKGNDRWTLKVAFFNKTEQNSDAFIQDKKPSSLHKAFMASVDKITNPQWDELARKDFWRFLSVGITPNGPCWTELLPDKPCNLQAEKDRALSVPTSPAVSTLHL